VKQRLLFASFVLMFAFVAVGSARAFGSGPNSNDDDAPGAPPEAANHALPDAPAPMAMAGEGAIFKPRPGIVLKFSSLGAGIEGGVSLNRFINIRGGSNFLNLSHGFSASGIRYDATLHFRSAEALVDITPLGDLFHISPGAILYNGNQIIATAHVPGGQNFDLGNITVRSSPADPIHGTGKLTVNRSAPMIMFGFGNPIPHNHHVTIFHDFGIVFQGAPKTTLNLAGTACDPVTGLACVNAATDPTIQAQIQNEQTKITNDLAIVKFYPIASFGIGIRF
jgi:hypothetical protein